jgi:DNA-binding MarR family transcriptional regulator
MPTRHLLVLLVVARFEAQEGGLLMTQIAGRLEVPLSSVSRAVRQLSKTNRQLNDGLDLVVAQTDLANQRQKPVKLTPRGRMVVEQYLKTVYGKDA